MFQNWAYAVPEEGENFQPIELYGTFVSVRKNVMISFWPALSKARNNVHST